MLLIDVLPNTIYAREAFFAHVTSRYGLAGDLRAIRLKSFAHDLVIRKLSPPSSGSVPSCWRIYSWITSSVTLPLDAYRLAQLLSQPTPAIRTTAGLKRSDYPKFGLLEMIIRRAG